MLFAYLIKCITKKSYVTGEILTNVHSEWTFIQENLLLLRTTNPGFGTQLVTQLGDNLVQRELAKHSRYHKNLALVYLFIRGQTCFEWLSCTGHKNINLPWVQPVQDPSGFFTNNYCPAIRISICPHPVCSIVIATKFYTCQDSCAVVTCAKFCSYPVYRNWNTTDLFPSYLNLLMGWYQWDGPQNVPSGVWGRK